MALKIKKVRGIKRIHIGGDHAGFHIKEKLKPLLEEQYTVIDHGPYVYNKNDDYPDFVIPLARAVVKEEFLGLKSCGIVIAGTGQGEAMACNRIMGARATIYYGPKDREFMRKMITLSKEHNNSNIICLGAFELALEDVVEAVNIWLSIPFKHEERHKRRLEKIDQRIKALECMDI